MHHLSTLLASLAFVLSVASSPIASPTPTIDPERALFDSFASLALAASAARSPVASPTPTHTTIRPEFTAAGVYTHSEYWCTGKDAGCYDKEYTFTVVEWPTGVFTGVDEKCDSPTSCSTWTAVGTVSAGVFAPEQYQTWSLG